MVVNEFTVVFFLVFVAEAFFVFGFACAAGWLFNHRSRTACGPGA
jgi:hypothetical protein